MRSSTTADQVGHATEVEQENAVTGANDSGPTFEAHIKSLFRERDRVAMLDFFDLWSFDDVKANADAILAAVRTARCRATRRGRPRRSISSNPGWTVARRGREMNDPLPG